MDVTQHPIYLRLRAQFPDNPLPGFDLVAVLVEIGLLTDQTDPTGERRRALISMAEAAHPATAHLSLPRRNDPIQ